MNQNSKKIWIYLALSFGIPWTAALVISQSSIMENHPDQAAAIANGIFISFPWLANIAARLITREGWSALWLHPKIRKSWRYYLALWFLPFLATIAGGLIFYLLFSKSYDPNLSALRNLAQNASLPAESSPWTLFLQITFSLMFISVPINTVASMGEEFGWRAYLLPKLMLHFNRHSSVEDGSGDAPADTSLFASAFSEGAARKAAMLTGLIHGVWHLPLILMTTSSTPSASALTLLVYLLFTCSLSILLSWGTLKSGSAWPAAVGHGAANAASVLPGFLLSGQPVPWMGPDPTGLVGGLGYIILALVLLFGKGFTGGKEKIRTAPVKRCQISP